MPGSATGFPRHRRLTKVAEYRRVLRAGYKEQGGSFTIFAVASNTAHVARLGIGVSRRVATKANVRNRLKRQIRESFRYHQSELAGLDIVVIARRPAVELPNARARLALARHWKNICKRCKNSS